MYADPLPPPQAALFANCSEAVKQGRAWSDASLERFRDLPDVPPNVGAAQLAHAIASGMPVLSSHRAGTVMRMLVGDVIPDVDLRYLIASATQGAVAAGAWLLQPLLYEQPGPARPAGSITPAPPRNPVGDALRRVDAAIRSLDAAKVELDIAVVNLTALQARNPA